MSYSCYSRFYEFRNMAHRGEIVDNQIRKSGVSFAAAARLLKISRQTLYRYIEDMNLSFQVIEKIGKVIQHDFREEFPEMDEAMRNNILPEKRKVTVMVELDGTDVTFLHWQQMLLQINGILKAQA